MYPYPVMWCKLTRYYLRVGCVDTASSKVINTPNLEYLNYKTVDDSKVGIDSHIWKKHNLDISFRGNHDILSFYRRTV